MFTIDEYKQLLEAKKAEALRYYDAHKKDEQNSSMWQWHGVHQGLELALELLKPVSL